MQSNSFSFVVTAFALIMSVTSRASILQQDKTRKQDTALPLAVAQAVAANRPGARIDKLEVENEQGVNLYDIEFKAGKGEIEVAEDGTVIDIATLVKLTEIPKPALDAIKRGAAGAKITQLEKSEILAEVNGGKVVKLASPKYVYEAELVKGRRFAEIQVTPEGEVIEGPKWTTKKD